MLRIFVFRKKSAGWKIILGAGLIAGCCLAAPAADTIRGVARNQTRGQFAAGDEVILLRLGMSGWTKLVWSPR